MVVYCSTHADIMSLDNEPNNVPAIVISMVIILIVVAAAVTTITAIVIKVRVGLPIPQVPPYGHQVIIIIWAWDVIIIKLKLPQAVYPSETQDNIPEIQKEMNKESCVHYDKFAFHSMCGKHTFYHVGNIVLTCR